MKNILHKIKVPLYLITGIILAVYLLTQAIMFLPSDKSNKDLLEDSKEWPEFKDKIIEDVESYEYYSIRESIELENMKKDINDKYYLQKMKEQ